jgi:hypothetical protein
MKNLPKTRGRIKYTRGIIGETCYIISLHGVGSTLCVVILINMCCNPNLFYVPYFKFLCNYFFKFVVHKINSKIIKSEMVVPNE